MVALRRHAALISSLLIAHRGTFVNAHDESHARALKIEVNSVRDLPAEHYVFGVPFGVPDVYVCLYLTKGTTDVPTNLASPAGTTGPVHLEGSLVIGCTTSQESRNPVWNDAVFYILEKDIGFDAGLWRLQVHVWDEDIRSVSYLNSPADFLGGWKRNITLAELEKSPRTYNERLSKGNAMCSVTLSLEATPSAAIFDRSCMSFSDIDDTLAPGGHTLMHGGTMPGSDNRLSPLRNYPGFPLMLRKVCPNLTFLAARPSELHVGSLVSLPTKIINRWPQLAEVHKTNPFYHVAYLGGSPRSSVRGTLGCQWKADVDHQTGRPGCEPFATDKVAKYNRFMKRYPQYKRAFLFGDNGQGDFSAWKQIVANNLPADIQVRAFIRETLVDKCDNGKCVYRWLNATTGYDASMAHHSTPGDVHVVRGWRCLLPTLRKNKHLTEMETREIEEVMETETNEIRSNLALYGGAGVDDVEEQKLYFNHWVKREHVGCGGTAPPTPVSELDSFRHLRRASAPKYTWWRPW
eukprot:GEMP01027466.1.p1 GENE.GEMP01027466.1~~GEMP01027466.1.p1  ORF type:complete len:539 (+),score=83.62 GEMP01027466.1:59-1618(+)